MPILTSGDIRADLSLIERTQGVRILFAVESGSRVWGFHSPNSDYDVRFVYVRPLAWYLSTRERRDVIEMPVRGLLDTSGWDLKKSLTLLAKSNPPLLEWLHSSMFYRADDAFVQGMRALAADYFNARSTIYHYLHMANGNYRSYLKGAEVPLKKYFYVIRPLLACLWVHRHSSMPPVSFVDLYPAADWNHEVQDAVTQLLRLKRSGVELVNGPQIPAINAWIETKLAFFSDLARTTAVGKNKHDDIDEFFLSQLFAEIRGALS